MKGTVAAFVVAPLLAAAAFGPGLAAAESGVKAEKVPFRLSDGTAIVAEVRWPATGPVARARDRVPALLLFGGFEHAAEVLDLVRPKVPVALASFDYPFEGSRSFSFPGTLADAPELRKSVPRTIEGMRRLAAWLSAHPRIEPDRVGILGASFASPFATAVAAQDERVRALVLVHGFGDPRGTLGHRLQQVFSRKLGWFAPALAGPAAFVVDSYLELPRAEEDAARLRSGQIALMIEATEDEFIPKRSRESLWQGLSSSQARVERVPMPGGHLMPGAGPLIERILGVTTDWLQKQGFLRH